MGFLQNVVNEARMSVSETSVSSQLTSVTDIGGTVPEPFFNDSIDGTETGRQENLLTKGSVNMAPPQSQLSSQQSEPGQTGKLLPQEKQPSEDGKARKTQIDTTKSIQLPQEFHVEPTNKNQLQEPVPTPMSDAPEIKDFGKQEPPTEQQPVNTKLSSPSLLPETPGNQVETKPEVSVLSEKIEPVRRSDVRGEDTLIPETITTPIAVEVRAAEDFPGQKAVPDSLTNAENNMPSIPIISTLLDGEKETRQIQNKVKSDNLQIETKSSTVKEIPTRRQNSSPDSKQVDVRQVLKDVTEPLETPSAIAGAPKNNSAIRKHKLQPLLSTVKHHHAEKEQKTKIIEKKVIRAIVQNTESIRDTPLAKGRRQQPAEKKPPIQKLQPEPQYIQTGSKQPVMESAVKDTGKNRQAAPVPQQKVYTGGKKPYFPAMPYPQPINKQPEVKIGQVDVFIEGPQQSHGSNIPSRPTLSLASRHYLRRI